MSFDLSRAVVEELLRPLPEEPVVKVRTALKSQPFRVDLEGKVVVQLAGAIGELTRGPYEEFVPIVVSQATSSRFDPNVVLTPPQERDG